MSNTHVFKLVSGEEFVAKVEGSITADVITVSKARLLHIIQTGPNEYGLQLIPLMKGAPDDDLEVFKHAIMIHTPASAALERSYLSQTSSIEIASSLSPLIGA